MLNPYSTFKAAVADGSIVNTNSDWYRATTRAGQELLDMFSRYGYAISHFENETALDPHTMQLSEHDQRGEE